jgi:RNA polymerase sigma-70 factor (ECF subfamily)
MDEQAALHVEDLLEKAEWIRALARSLARDPDRAEDLAQSTLALALERRPAEGVPRRRWFAAVMRNLLRQDLRASRRRQAREETAARPEAVPSENELLDRLEVQRRVVEAVRALMEPFRSTVLLRYFEGLSPEEIGKRTGTPVRTVHSRLNRAHHLLREQLDAEFGDRSAWLALLLPPFHPTSVGGGATLLASKIAIVTCVAGVLVLAAWKLEGGLSAETSRKDSRGEEGLEVSLARMPIPRLASPADAAPRKPIAAIGGGAPGPGPTDCVCPKRDPDAPSDTRTRLEGRVVDLEGHPVDDAEVYCTTRLDSSYDAGIRLEQRTFEVKPGRGTTVTTFSRSIIAGGMIENFGGRRTFGGSSATQGKGYLGDGPEAPLSPYAISGPGGRFEVSLLGLLHGSLFHARKTGLVPVLAYDYEPKGSGGSGLGAPPLLVVAETSAVSGIVVDEHRRPLSGIEVVVRVLDSVRSTVGVVSDDSDSIETFAHTGEDGRFEIPNAPRVEGRRLHVAREGSPAVVRSLSAEPERDLRIELGVEPASAVHGVVLDDTGSPVAGARVGFGWPGFDAEPDGRFVLDAANAAQDTEIVAVAPGFLPVHEHFDAGRDGYELRCTQRAQVLTGRVLDDDGNAMSEVELWIENPTPFGTTTLECIGNGRRTFTDADGRFEMAGLLDRSYDLGLLDRRTLRTGSTVSVLARSRDVDLRFRSADRAGRVAGRVVDAKGEPVPRAELVLQRSIVHSENGKAEKVDLHAHANSRGVFELPRVALDLESVSVAFPWDVAVRRPLATGEDFEHLVLVAQKRAHFRIDLADTKLEADAFELFDPSGERLPISMYEGSTTISSVSGEIVGGESQILATAASAETLVLRRSKAEVARIPIHLVPGEVTILRP